MKPVPSSLLDGPFTRGQALSLGVTPTMLRGRRFVRLFPRVWRHHEREMTERDWIRAAQLALGTGAHLTGITRIQLLGLDYGSLRPLHFVVQGELHLAIEGLFLHRTKRLPPTDGVGVTPAAAFLAYCRRASVLDAIKVGDWLLFHRHATLREIRDLALAEPWRDGALEAIWILDHLDARSRSVKESETRAVVVFAGLPRPAVNQRVTLTGDAAVIGDLVIRPWGLVLEYEGEQHQLDRAQFTSDIDRYALLRAHHVPYVQITKERLRTPKIMLGVVYRELLSLGYDGPPPQFGDRWRQLLCPVHAVLEPHRAGRAVS